MRRTVWVNGIGLIVGIVVVALAVASGFGRAETVGIGFLDVGDLQVSSGQGHPVGQTVEMRGRLALQANGCVTVIVDGVERMPLWPEGTDVSQAPGNLERYVVDLPGDVTLNVDAATADEFSAAGAIDMDEATFASKADETPGKVSSFMAYCGIKVAPVAFPDAATFVHRGTSRIG